MLRYILQTNYAKKKKNYRWWYPRVQKSFSVKQAAGPQYFTFAGSVMKVLNSKSCLFYLHLFIYMYFCWPCEVIHPELGILIGLICFLCQNHRTNEENTHPFSSSRLRVPFHLTEFVMQVIQGHSPFKQLVNRYAFEPRYT